MCFSMPWLQQMFINLVIVCAVVALIRLFIPFLVTATGLPILGQALEIVLWAVIAIFVIIIIFGLIGCLTGMGGFSLLPHPR